jgi:hypothetical protein
MADRRYEVHVQGRLSAQLQEAFAGMDVSVIPAETVISGPVGDDDQLHALLSLIQSLGLHVESVEQVPR